MILLFHISQWFIQISFLIVVLVFLLRPKIIKLFSRYGCLRYIALVTLAALLWLRPFVSLCAGVPGEADAPLHLWLSQLFPPGEPTTAVLGFILLLSEAFYLNFILIRINVIPKKSLLPAAFYILMMSQSVQGLTLNPVLSGAAFVLPALDLIFNSRDGRNLTVTTFSAAVLFALASLFCFEFLFFFPLIFVSLRLFKNTSGMQTALAAMIGFSVVFLLLLLFYFLVGDLAEQMGIYAKRILYPPLLWRELEMPQYILIGWQAYIYYMAILTVLANRDNLNDYMRKIMFFSISFVLLSLVSILYMFDNLALALMFPAIPSTIFIGASISLIVIKKMMMFVEMILLTSCMTLIFYNLWWAVC